MKKSVEAVTATIAAIIIAFGLPVAAQATESVSGILSCDGSLIQYATYRWHNPGTWGMTISDNVSTYSRFGMRNASGLQVTNTIQFNTTGYKGWGYHSGGAAYAINGRMGPDNTACKSSWSGTLHI